MTCLEFFLDFSRIVESLALRLITSRNIFGKLSLFCGVGEDS